MSAQREVGILGRNLVGTGMPVWLVLVLVGLGLPRTILSDLGVVEPEGSWVYYVLALTPFAVWFAVAAFVRTRTPFRDHLVVGALYGLSLVVVHEALWAVGSSLGQHTALDGFAAHATSFGIAMMIGLGVGLTAGAVAAASKGVRTLRAR